MNKKIQLPFTGERFVPEEKGNIFIEHYHRYIFAKQFVKDKIVLDIASGEGYGSDILSKEAKKVIGIDISNEAVSHAQKKYEKENLEYLVGECKNTGLPSNSIDVIVSFETLEHHDEHIKTMHEFKRILKKGGILIISTPDKKNYTDDKEFNNTFHVKELYETEFNDLINQFFKFNKLFAQKILFGSCIIEKKHGQYNSNYIYKDNKIQEINESVCNPLYYIAVASDVDFSNPKSSILEQEINDSEYISEWQNAIAKVYEKLDQITNVSECKDKVISDLKNQITNVSECKDKVISDLKNQIIDTLKISDNINYLINKSSSIDLHVDRIENYFLKEQRKYTTLTDLMTPKKNTLSNLGRNIERKVRKLRKKLFVNSSYNKENKQDESLRIIDQINSPHEITTIQPDSIQEWTLPVVIQTICILTPLHTLFLANIIKRQMEIYGINVTIAHKYDENKVYHVNFVLCAQIFEKLPPIHNTVIIQLEQSVNSRWFDKKYFSILKKYHYIIDYSINNIEYLVDNNISLNKIFYIPVGGCNSQETCVSEKKYDFLFYGDSLSSERRRKFLTELSKKFSVKICNDLFGEDLYQLMNQCHCVINIHYYENALLETPRIFESLSMGKPVLSESSTDQNQYPEVIGSVLFFKEDSVDDMLEKASYLMNHIKQYTDSIHTTLEKSQHRFSFMLNRFLVAAGIVQKKFLLEEPIYLEKELNVIALSMPETGKRRYSCLTDKTLPSFSLFDGIRFQPGWQACAYGYKILAQHFLETGDDLVTIFEDDAFLLEKKLVQYETVKKYLRQRETPWDIYVGVIADLHADTKILHIEEWNGIKFITLNKMTSTVFNIYNRTGLRYLADWPAENEDVHSNTIDRYLQNRSGINIVTSYPFIAGHKEELSSTLWGIKNDVYSSMIKESEQKLFLLIENYLNKGAGIDKG